MRGSTYYWWRRFRKEFRKKFWDLGNIRDETIRLFGHLRAWDNLMETRRDYERMARFPRSVLFVRCMFYTKFKSLYIDIRGRKRHLFHIVFPTSWPYHTATSLFFLLSSVLFYFNGFDGSLRLILMWISILIFVLFGWFRAIVDEATFKGHHTMVVRHGLVDGFILFIVSEVMLFFGLFWAFYHCTISPSVQVGYLIPADGILNVSYAGVPFFNTCLLTCSSLFVTLAHKGVEQGSFRTALDGLFMTILLGFIFLTLQINEYRSCFFNISDGAYPSIFYVLTGLHGLHVFIGLVLLIVNSIRLILRHFTTEHHLGLLFSIWYWHFVDVIWMAVYCFVYIWLASTVLLYWLVILVGAIILLYLANR